MMIVIWVISLWITVGGKNFPQKKRGVSVNNILEPQKGIFEFTTPQTIDTGKWANEHLDCDAIIDNHGSMIVVYAFTVDPKYNSALGDFRRKKYRSQKILRGISSNGLNSLI